MLIWVDPIRYGTKVPAMPVSFTRSIFRNFLITVFVAAVSHAAIAGSRGDRLDLPVQTEQDVTDPDETSVTVGKNPASVRNRINQINQPVEARVPTDAFESWYAAKENLSQTTGLQFGFFYSPMVQAATNGARREAAGGTFDFNASWNMIGRDTEMPGYLLFRYQDRHAYNDLAPTLLFTETGSLWPTTIGYNEFRSVLELAWEQHLIKDRLIVKFGRTPPFANHDFFRYKAPFNAFNEAPLTINPTIAFTAAGIGAGIAFRPTDDTYIIAGLHDANGSTSRAGFDTFFKTGEYLTIVDVGWDPGYYNPENAVYFGDLKVTDVHVTVWHRDALKKAGAPDGWGATFFAEGEIGRFVPFVRAGFSWGTDGGPALLNHMISAGFGLSGMFGYEDDVLGFAMTWGGRNVGSIDTDFDGVPDLDVGDVNQFSSEFFYDMQLTQELAVSPHAQIIINPAVDPTKDVVGVFGLRAVFAM